MPDITLATFFTITITSFDTHAVDTAKSIPQTARKESLRCRPAQAFTYHSARRGMPMYRQSLFDAAGPINEPRYKQGDAIYQVTLDIMHAFHPLSMCSLIHCIIHDTISVQEGRRWNAKKAISR
jgi:hypothetical protein